MSINLPVWEIVVIMFFWQLFKWGFRFCLLLVIGKVINGLKEKGSNSLKDFQEKLKGEQENG